MNKLIALDDGHGYNTAGKRTPPIIELDNRVILENEFNCAVVGYLDEELRRLGFKTLLTAPNLADIPLKTRVDMANEAKADLFISVHYNAFDGSFCGADPSGVEVHCYKGSIEGRKLAKCILDQLIQGTPQINRGIKESEFYVLKYTKMPAILSENGFMDNKREALLMINDGFRREVAQEHARGICDYYGVKYTPINQHWATGYYEQLKGLGLVSEARLDDTVTRGEMMAIISRALGLK
jgi:N-acetylmuramoyl-L-alanine amidase